MRKGEILNLKWDNIRNGYIYLEKTKTKESRQIPINDDLAAMSGATHEITSRLLNELHDRGIIGLNEGYIIIYDRLVIENVEY